MLAHGWRNGYSDVIVIRHVWNALPAPWARPLFFLTKCRYAAAWPFRHARSEKLTDVIVCFERSHGRGTAAERTLRHKVKL